MFFPGEGNFDPSLWSTNGSDIWGGSGGSGGLGVGDLWANLGEGGISPDFYDVMSATPPPGIECSPTPGELVLM